MHFISPFFLLFLPLILVPIILHLISRKKRNVIEFSDTRFLKEIINRTRMKLRLINILLLFLRILILLFLILAFARPISSAKYTQNGYTVIVIDTSYSMIREFDKVRLCLKNVIESLDNEMIEIIETSIPREIVKFTNNKKSIIEKINEIECSYKQGTLLNGLNLAFDLLDQVASYNKKIIVISDFATHSFKGIDKNALSKFDNKVKLIFIKIGENESNIAIKYTSFTEPIEDTLWNITLEIVNYSEKYYNNTPVEIVDINNNKLYTGFVDIKPNKINQKQISIKLDNKKNITGKIFINNPDKLQIDNYWYFSFPISPIINLLIVDGDYGISFYSDSYYLNKVLISGAKENGIKYKIIPSYELNNVSFNEFDIIFLCNVKEITQEVAEKISYFLSSGKTIFFILGENINRKNYNNLFLTLLLPFTISESKSGKFYVKKINIPNMENIEKIFFLKYFLVKTNLTPLIMLDNNDGILYEFSKFNGKVYLLTTGVNYKCTNFVIKPSFVSFIYELIKCTKDVADKPSFNFYVGEKIKKVFPFSYHKVELITPTNVKSFNLSFQKDHYEFEYEINLPGIYKIKYGKNIEHFAANLLCNDESNLTQIPNSLLRSIFNNDLMIIKYDKSVSLAKVLKEKEITTYFLYISLILFLIESFLATYFYKS